MRVSGFVGGQCGIYVHPNVLSDIVVDGYLYLCNLSQQDKAIFMGKLYLCGYYYSGKR